MPTRPLHFAMQRESAVRVALVRLFAIRHGRDVPLAELQRALDAEGVPRDSVEPTLIILQEKRVAVRTTKGWRPAGLAPRSRAREPMAQFSWLHA